MATHKVRPDPGAPERQHRRQRRRTIRRKMGVYGLVAALAAAIAAMAGCGVFDSAGQEPTGRPSSSPPAPPVATLKFDGSTCSMEISAERIEPGVVLFEAVNASEQSAMFDSWQLLGGYTFRAFEATVERFDRRRAEAGTPALGWPGEREAPYLGSDVIPANSSGTIVATMSAGRHAITCLQRYKGGRSGRFPSGIVGPIIVG